MKIREWAWVPAILFAGIVIPGMTAPHADAAPYVDPVFIEVLDAEGIGYTSPAAATQAGMAVCEFLDSGWGLMATVGEVIDASGLDASRAAYFVGASIGAFCPWHASKVYGLSV